MQSDFEIAWNELAQQVHQNAYDNGFWPQGRNEAEIIALEHSELSEALEALRHGNPPSEAIDATSVAEELADLVIRIMDHAAGCGHDVARAIVLKMEHNRGRPHKHGKAF